MIRWMLAALVLIATAAPVIGSLGAFDANSRDSKPQAGRIWGTAATAGDANAQYQLGFAHEEGIGAAADHRLAARWYGAAAHQGHAAAQAALAVMLREGRGVAQDFVAARTLAEAAAEQGSETGAYLLGLIHSRGEGTAVDAAQAFRWFLTAERRGHLAAAHHRKQIARLVPAAERLEIRKAVLDAITL